MNDDCEKLFTVIENNSHSIISITLSKPAAEKTDFIRVKIRPVSTKEGLCFYVEEATLKQTFHKNLNAAELNRYIRQNAATAFKQLYMETAEETFSLLTGKKENSTLIKKPRKSAGKNAPPENAACDELNLISGQNRIKKYLISEGEPVPFLVKLGVMTGEGRIHAAKYAKFRQINRFLEFIDDVLEPLLTDEVSGLKKEKISVIDYGCGKSYLTFAVCHFFRQKNIAAHIIGLDLKKDVVDFCNKLAAECEYDNVRFYCGDIASFAGAEGEKPPEKADLVISLHACDTATDYALSRAVALNARVVLSVPCCQHELNTVLTPKKTADEFAALIKHGIVKERFAALATDVMRAELLESAGYSVQILEFIDTEHTPKNLLIRAVKKSGAKNATDRKNCGLSESYIKLRDALSSAPLLEKLL